MSTLLEKALERVVALPEDEQDAIASQILTSISDEEAWKVRFTGNRAAIRRMAAESIEEDERGDTRTSGLRWLQKSSGRDLPANCLSPLTSTS